MTDQRAATTTATDHRGLSVLGFDACLERLRGAKVGRLAFVSAGESVILPINHGMDGTNVVFRTKEGSKLFLAGDSHHVAFEVDRYDDEAEAGWSVVVKGTAELVYEDDDIARLNGLGLRSWADPAGAGQWVRIRPAEISGRELSA